MPTLAFAQINPSNPNTTGLSDTLDRALGFVNQGTYLLVAIAILIFIYGIVKYVIADNEEAKANGQKLILWGVIGLFAIVAVWGLVTFLANTTGIGTGSTPPIPCPPGFTSC